MAESIEQLNVRIPRSLHREIKTLCVKRDISVMDFVTAAIEERLGGSPAKAAPRLPAPKPPPEPRKTAPRRPAPSRPRPIPWRAQFGHLTAVPELAALCPECSQPVALGRLDEAPCGHRLEWALQPA